MNTNNQAVESADNDQAHDQVASNNNQLHELAPEVSAHSPGHQELAAGSLIMPRSIMVPILTNIHAELVNEYECWTPTTSIRTISTEVASEPSEDPPRPYYHYTVPPPLPPSPPARPSKEAMEAMGTGIMKKCPRCGYIVSKTDKPKHAGVCKKPGEFDGEDKHIKVNSDGTVEVDYSGP